MDTISINHNWVNGCSVNKMWASMIRNLDDVKKEITCFKDSMDNWHEHCQLILKSCFGMNFEDFYKFLKFILKTRKFYLQMNQKYKVYGDWIMCSNHLNFDVMKIQEVVDTFQNDNNVRLLLREKNIEELD